MASMIHGSSSGISLEREVCRCPAVDPYSRLVASRSVKASSLSPKADPGSVAMPCSSSNARDRSMLDVIPRAANLARCAEKSG